MMLVQEQDPSCALQVHLSHWSLSLPGRPEFRKALRTLALGKCLSLIDFPASSALLKQIAGSSSRKDQILSIYDMFPYEADVPWEPYFENQGHSQLFEEFFFPH